MIGQCVSTFVWPASGYDSKANSNGLQSTISKRAIVLGNPTTDYTYWLRAANRPEA